MSPDRAVVPSLKHRHVTGDHGDLVRVRIAPVEVLCCLAYAARSGQEPGISAPNKADAVKDAAVIAQKRLRREADQTTVLHVLVPRVRREQRPSILNPSRCRHEVVLLALGFLCAASKLPAGPGVPERISQRVAAVFDLIDLSLHFFKKNSVEIFPTLFLFRL